MQGRNWSAASARYFRPAPFRHRRQHHRRNFFLSAGPRDRLPRVNDYEWFLKGKAPKRENRFGAFPYL